MARKLAHVPEMSNCNMQLPGEGELVQVPIHTMQVLCQGCIHEHRGLPICNMLQVLILGVDAINPGKL